MTELNPKELSKKLNNFYGFFPEGFIRERDFDDSLYKSVIKEVNRLIIETRFDLQRYLKIERIRGKSIQKGFSILNHGRGYDAAKHYLERGDKFAQLRNEMIMPIYKEMLKLGFEEKTLRA